MQGSDLPDVRRRLDAQVLAILASETRAQAAFIREQDAALLLYKKIIGRASAEAKIGIWECNLADNALTWTDGTYDLFELPRGAAITRAQIVEFYEADSCREMERLREKAIAERSAFTHDVRIRTARGNERWMRLTGNVECENEVPVRIFGMKQDITEEKNLLDRLRFLADRDPLTGLANRGLLQKRLADGRDPAGALILIDLDGFKQINDMFGHSAGDECLTEVARRLRQVCSPDELVARIGGDEFAIVMPAGAARDTVEGLAERLLAELRVPIGWSDHVFVLSGSIGVAVATREPADEASRLFVEADLALYASKADGRNTARVFTSDLSIKADARFTMIRAIGMAMRDNQLALFYQPKLRLADGRLTGFEALLRWRRADGRITPAGDFAVVFEDAPLAKKIGDWVVATALHQAGCWTRAGIDFGHVAINLSAIQFRELGFADHLIERIAAEGIRADMVQFEVTESVFSSRDSGLVMTALRRLRAAGIRIALDDFGTGHASLVHLSTYPIDIIKIDTSLVQSFLASRQDRAIIEAILGFGLRLGIDILAEGIETMAQCEGLERLGCLDGQGFLFAHALPAEDAAKWHGPIVARSMRVA